MDRRNDLRTNPPALTKRQFPAHISPSVVFVSELIAITGIRDHHRLEHLIAIPGIRRYIALRTAKKFMPRKGLAIVAALTGRVIECGGSGLVGDCWPIL